ncbi:MAG: hypothetical protein ACHP7C_00235 [Lysobacterales bacterium]
MKPAFSQYAVMAFCAVALLAGCSQQSGMPAPDAAQQQAQSQATDATRNLETYRQLLRIHNDGMAVTMGQDIVKRFPDSAAAKEVQQTLPAIEKRYTEASEKNRLAGLWLYQVSPMEGGTQSTATIVNGQSSSNERVQLVLRRHTSWGQSVFLYGNKPGFVCRGNCSVAGMVDGKPVHITAFAPSTGEPALMIRDDKAFIAMLQKAKKITLDVTLADGDKKQTLIYEVGGFDPAKWASVGKQKKK